MRYLKGRFSVGGWNPAYAANWSRVFGDELDQQLDALFAEVLDDPTPSAPPASSLMRPDFGIPAASDAQISDAMQEFEAAISEVERLEKLRKILANL